MSTPRGAAIKSLMKFLNKSEANRFAPKEEAPKAQEEAKDEMSPDVMAALEAVANSKE